MPHFDAFYLIKWLHLAAFSLGGGGAILTLVLSGVEEGQGEAPATSAYLWKKIVCWAFRLALVLGLGLLWMRFRAGDTHPFDAKYLHFKMVLVLALMGASEAAPKGLLRGRRGAALLAIVCFLLTTFVSINAMAFGTRVRVAPPTADAGVYQAR